MIYLSGHLTGDSKLKRRGLEGMEFLLNNAFISGEILQDAAKERRLEHFPLMLINEGTWGEKFLPLNQDTCFIENGISLYQQWWIHCEMDQAAATCAMIDSKYTSMLAQTSLFFINHYVDRQNGEVWHSIDPITLQPSLMKVHLWKNAYHSFEHTLVMAIASAFINKKSITLHYFSLPNQNIIQNLYPYYFEGDVINIQYGTVGQSGSLSVAVTFIPKKLDNVKKKLY